MSALTDAIAASIAAHPDKPALIFGEDSISYAALGNRVARQNRVLREAGVHRGSRIGVVLGNTPAFVTVLLAAAQRGAAIVPVSPAMADGARAGLFRDCGVSAVVVADTRGEPVVRPFDRPSGGEESRNPNASAYDGDALIISATSGSTGRPKPIIFGHDTKYRRAHSAIAGYGVTGTDTVLVATPLYHSLGQRLIFISLLAGARLRILPAFSPLDWLTAVGESRVRFTIGVASQLIQLTSYIADPAWHDVVRSLRCVVVSSAPMPVEAKTRLLEVTDAAMHECYGTSEMGIVSNLDLRAHPDRADTVGWPLDEVAVRILDEQGQSLPPGSTGEIACRSPMMCHGYLNRPDENAQAFAQGFFKTKDLGLVASDGALVYRGRKDFVINSGGFNVFPEDIEDVVHAHPEVLESAAFGWPHERLGEEVAVAVVPVPGSTLAERDVRRWCVQRLAGHQHPRRIFVVTFLPKTEMGKVDRFELVSSNFDT